MYKDILIAIDLGAENSWAKALPESVGRLNRAGMPRILVAAVGKITQLPWPDPVACWHSLHWHCNIIIGSASVS